MPVPLSDTATPLAPLRDRIHAQLVLTSDQADEVVAATRAVFARA